MNELLGAIKVIIVHGKDGWTVTIRQHVQRGRGKVLARGKSRNGESIAAIVERTLAELTAAKSTPEGE